MRVSDLIAKKRDGGALTSDEIRFLINGYTKGTIPDYQMSALTMAIYFRGMTTEETAALTFAMADSGDKLLLPDLPGTFVDKHSTGGVGDKTSLIVGPIVAACGGKIAKMSGAGLGHTGGTTDKLSSIPGYRVDLNRDEIVQVVEKCGICITGSTGELAPADKKLYALRDVTAAVNSIPLIAASIMSKKIAGGAHNIVLDVKTGSGAFMKKISDAKALASEMVSIGNHRGLNVTALITNMDAPLGYAIGNTLEVIEAIQTLHGVGPADLTEICLQLATQMLRMCCKASKEECYRMASNALYNGLAYERFVDMVRAQGGDPEVLNNTALFRKSVHYRTLKANTDGYIQRMNAEKWGIAAMQLGAGRRQKGDAINYAAGIVLDVKPGHFVSAGDTIATLYADDDRLFDAAADTLSDAFVMGDRQPKPIPMIIDTITNM